MTRVFRDLALVQNQIEAVVRNAGAAGIPLKDALVRVANRDPQGSDYQAAINLRKLGTLLYVKNLPRNQVTVIHKDFEMGPPSHKAVAAKSETPTPTKRRRKTARKHSVGVLITLQYGRNETVTLTYEQARDLYNQLAGVFAG